MVGKKQSRDARAIQVAKLLAAWRGSKRATVSLDIDTYEEFLFGFTPNHIIHDESTRDPILVLLNRKAAIKALEDSYNLKEGDGLDMKKELVDGTL